MSPLGLGVVYFALVIAVFSAAGIAMAKRYEKKHKH